MPGPVRSHARQSRSLQACQGERKCVSFSPQLYFFPLQVLSAEVASYLGLELGKIKIKRFADGEIYVQVQVRWL